MAGRRRRGVHSTTTTAIPLCFCCGIGIAALLFAADVAVDVVRGHDDSEDCRLTDPRSGKRYDINILHGRGPEEGDYKAVEKQGDVLDPNTLLDGSKSAPRNFEFFIQVCGELDGNYVRGVKKYDSRTAVVQVEDNQDHCSNEGKGDCPVYSTALIEGDGEDEHATLKSLRQGDLRYSYVKSENQEHCKNGRNTEIIFFCADVGLGSPEFIDEMQGDSQECKYVFAWHTCAACPMGSKIRNACPSVADACLIKMQYGETSTISILIIVLFFLFLGYMLAQILYRRFVQGAKGYDQIPHLALFVEFFGLVKEGFHFITSCCRPPPQGTISYKGLSGNYDEDDDSDLDDDADDTLYS